MWKEEELAGTRRGHAEIYSIERAFRDAVPAQADSQSKMTKCPQALVGPSDPGSRLARPGRRLPRIRRAHRPRRRPAPSSTLDSPASRVERVRHGFSDPATSGQASCGSTCPRFCPETLPQCRPQPADAGAGNASSSPRSQGVGPHTCACWADVHYASCGPWCGRNQSRGGFERRRYE